MKGGLNFHNVIPFSEEGFGVLHNTYGGGRVGVMMSHFGGIGKLFYLGAQPERAPRVLFEVDTSTAYGRLFRHQILVEGEAYNLEFKDTSHYPFGYSSTFGIERLGVKVRHGLTLLDSALVFFIEVISNPRGLRLAQRFEHHLNVVKGAPASLMRDVSAWEAFLPCDGWTQVFREEVREEEWLALQQSLGQPPNEVNFPCMNGGLRKSVTRLALFSSQGGLAKRETHSGRIYFTGEEFSAGKRAFVLLLGEDNAAFLKQATFLRLSAEEVENERAEWITQRIQELPEIKVDQPIFESCLANVNPSLEVLMPAGVPGGLRASSTNYWVWGWDTLLSAEVHLLAGKKEFFRDMLRLFRDTADPEVGYAHMFTRDMKSALIQAPSAQCLYIIQLYNYHVYTGKAFDVAEFYPFAKSIFESNLRTINARGLGDGPALFPDFPRYAGHNGHDISVFNNSLLYQGSRCIEVLAAVAGDKSIASEARHLSRRMEESFLKTFWDEDRCYFVDSVDSRTFEQRHSYPAHALIWQSAWLEDLAGDQLAACGQFQREHLHADRGFVMYPRWNGEAFDGDGNQLAQIWHTHDVFVTRCLAAAGHVAILRAWIEHCSWFWEQLTYIEGYSAQTVNDSGTLDQPGVKQAFGAKSIYGATLTGLAGLHFDIGGITLEEGIDHRLYIDRLPFREMSLSFEIEGEGRYPDRLVIDGKAILGTRKIPQCMLSENSLVLFQRTSRRPTSPVIMSLHGAEIHFIDVQADFLRAEVSGSGDVWIRFYSPFIPDLVVNGERVDIHFDSQNCEGKALLPLSAVDKIVFEIFPSISAYQSSQETESDSIVTHHRG